MDKSILKKGQRGGNMSQEQKKVFIELMEAAEDLRKGKFHPLFTYKDSQRQWKEIGEKLNAIPGAKKDWIHWRRTWQDMKKIVKRKNTNIKKHVNSTGGGPPTNTVMTKDEENILKILDATAVEGDAEVEESKVIFITENQNYNVETNVEITEIVEAENHEEAYIGGNEVMDEETNERKNKPMKRKNRKPVATQRLEYSLNANENLSRIAAEKVEIKKKYYEKKIEILKENVVIGKRIATALENISQSLQNK